MNVGLAAALLGACTSLDAPAAESYDEIREAIILDEAADGSRFATSEPVAETDTWLIGEGALVDEAGSGAIDRLQRATDRYFVEGRSKADGIAVVHVVRKRSLPVMETAIEEKSWPDTDPRRAGRIGDPWGQVKLVLLEYRHECPPSRTACIRYVSEALELSGPEARALLARNPEKIRVNYNHRAGTAAWTLDADHLRAVLDVLENVAGP